MNSTPTYWLIFLVVSFLIIDIWMREAAAESAVQSSSRDQHESQPIAQPEFYQSYGPTDVQLLSADGKPLSNYKVKLEILITERNFNCMSEFKMASAFRDNSCLSYSYAFGEELSDQKGQVHFEGGFWSHRIGPMAIPAQVRLTGDKIWVPNCSNALELAESPKPIKERALASKTEIGKKDCQFYYGLKDIADGEKRVPRTLQCKFPTLTKAEIEAAVKKHQESCNSV